MGLFSQPLWQDPPPVRRPGGRPQHSLRPLPQVLADLRERPGQWALVGAYAHQTSAASQGTQLRAAHPGFETTSRSDPQGGLLYARYVGTQEVAS